MLLLWLLRPDVSGLPLLRMLPLLLIQPLHLSCLSLHVHLLLLLLLLLLLWRLLLPPRTTCLNCS
jgi:hypothetical protein